MFPQCPRHRSRGFTKINGGPRSQLLALSLIPQLAEHQHHFLAERFSVRRRIQPQQGSVEAEHHAPFTATRELASRVSCFMRPTSRCKFRRPCAVNR